MSFPLCCDLTFTFLGRIQPSGGPNSYLLFYFEVLPWCHVYLFTSSLCLFPTFFFLLTCVSFGNWSLFIQACVFLCLFVSLSVSPTSSCYFVLPPVFIELFWFALLFSVCIICSSLVLWFAPPASCAFVAFCYQLFHALQLNFNQAHFLFFALPVSRVSCIWVLAIFGYTWQWSHSPTAVTLCNQYLLQNYTLKQKICLLPVWINNKWLIRHQINFCRRVAFFFFLSTNMWSGPEQPLWMK